MSGGQIVVVISYDTSRFVDSPAANLESDSGRPAHLLPRMRTRAAMLPGGPIVMINHYIFFRYGT